RVDVGQRRDALVHQLEEQLARLDADRLGQRADGDGWFDGDFPLGALRLVPALAFHLLAEPLAALPRGLVLVEQDGGAATAAPLGLLLARGGALVALLAALVAADDPAGLLLALVLVILLPLAFGGGG